MIEKRGVDMNSPFQKCVSSQVDVLERTMITPRPKLQEITFGDDKTVRRLKEFPFGDDFTPRKHRDNQADEDCTCTCGLPNKKYCMLTSLTQKERENRKKIVWAPMSICKVFSSSTPTVPYSTADILYGSEVNNRNQQDDVRQNGYVDLERGKDLPRQKSKDLEQHPNNRRPSSKSGSRKSLTVDTVTFDRDKEDPMKNLTSSLPPAKVTNHFRPNGIRSLKGEPQVYSSKTNGALSSRDQDDLVAMGTLWSPNNNTNAQQQQQPPSSSSSAALASSQQQQQQPSSRQNSITANGNGNSFPTKAASSSNNIPHSVSSTNNSMAAQRKYTSNNVRPIMVQNNSGKKINLKDQEDPKYTDPLIGAPASFQQRIIELGALEGDTVRWERTKRLKKKKQDRDS